MRHYSLRRALLSENYSVVGTDKVPATTISPIQRDLNVLHVFGGLKYHRPGGRGRPILCCRDLRDGSLHVIDGHHGWAVACIKNDEVSIKIINADPETIAIRSGSRNHKRRHTRSSSTGRERRARNIQGRHASM